MKNADLRLFKDSIQLHRYVILMRLREFRRYDDRFLRMLCLYTCISLRKKTFDQADRLYEIFITKHRERIISPVVYRFSQYTEMLHE